MLKTFFILIVCLLAFDVHAGRCRAGPRFLDNVDISAGAQTGAAQLISGFNDLVLELDLTDASDGITNIRITYTVSDLVAGQTRAFSECSVAAPVLTCAIRALDWDPRNAQGGKNWVLPIAVTYEWMIITATPTGNGAGDRITIDSRICNQ